jgi:sirohydrochlorin cobaltochelatase
MGILLAAFGAAVPGSRDGYEVFENEIHAKFPGVSVRWAYTANKIRRKLAERGYDHDSVAVALSRLYDEGVTHLAVQSLHTVPGVEYHWTLDQAMVYRHPRKGFLEVAVGGPLLASDEDLGRACDGLAGYIPLERTPDEAVVLVGHGTYHQGHQRYRDFEACAAGRDPLCFIGTLMGRPNCGDVTQAILDAGAKRVHLLPFMSVPGHHVRVDICGDHERSWKNRMTAAGLEVRAHLTGTLLHAPFRALWLEHLAQAYDSLTGHTHHSG